VPTITVGPSLILTNQRPVLCPLGLKNFTKMENKYTWRRIKSNKFKS